MQNDILTLLLWRVFRLEYGTMMKRLALSLVAATTMTSLVMADDCGEPPLDQPPVPASAQTADEIRDARDAVLSYSGKVDKYIACMDQRIVKFAPYMTKEQVARRQDDLNDLHNSRRELQLALNDAIRAYRRNTSGG